MTTWKILRSGINDSGITIDLRYAEFGKGTSKLRKWEIYRDGVKVNYAVNEGDAIVNYARAWNES